jgi:AraC-like DNA-binding protein
MPEHARIPTIASGALRKLLHALERLGVDADAVRVASGVDREVIDAPEGRLPVRSLHAAWAAAEQRLQRPDAALVVAEHYVPGDYGLVGFVAMNCATLADSLVELVRFGALWTDDPSFILLDDDTLAYGYQTSLPYGPGLRYANEAGFAEVLVAARLVTQTRFSPVSVSFAHARPKDIRAHEAFFGCPARFEAGETAMVFPREALSLPLPKADAQLGAFLRNVAGDALGRRKRESTPPERIKEIIGEELAHGLPPLDRIARRLATSERTLRRRLEEEGTSFRHILDETRAELAQGYVRDGRLPLSEVALLVGFSETSAFNRAFKRWTGSPPSAWRSQHGARGS